LGPFRFHVVIVQDLETSLFNDLMGDPRLSEFGVLLASVQCAPKSNSIIEGHSMAVSKKTLIGNNASSKNTPAKKLKADLAKPLTATKLNTASGGTGTGPILPHH
jgi:hypothetical protein